MSPLHRHEHLLLPSWNVKYLEITRFEAQMLACHWYKLREEKTNHHNKFGACKAVIWQHKQDTTVQARSVYTLDLKENLVVTTHIVDKEEKDKIVNNIAKNKIKQGIYNKNPTNFKPTNNVSVNRYRKELGFASDYDKED